MDSVKNWLIRLLRREPTTFRKPTSLALLADLAVERLIKFIQAIIKIKPATAPKSQIKRISPCGVSSDISYDFKLMSFTFCKCSVNCVTNFSASLTPLLLRRGNQ